MNGKTGKRAIAAALVIVALVALGQPVHAQQLSARYDRASYVPGDSGTLTVSAVNNDPTSTVEIRNLTIYFPWAQLVDGKWPSGANVTVNLSPWKTLGSSGSGNNVYTYPTSFTIPTWYGGTLFGGGGNCPSSNGPRYGLYSGCILIGITANTPRYQTQEFSTPMALPTYTPTSIVAEWLPIATLVVLVVATAFLGMAWMSLRRTSKKA